MLRIVLGGPLAWLSYVRYANVEVARCLGVQHHVEGGCLYRYPNARLAPCGITSTLALSLL